MASAVRPWGEARVWAVRQAPPWREGLLPGDRLGIHPRELRFGRDRCAHCGGRGHVRGSGTSDRDHLGAGGAGWPAGRTVVNLSCGPQNGAHAAALAVPAGVPGPPGPREPNWSTYGHVLGGADSLEQGSHVDMPAVCH